MSLDLRNFVKININYNTTNISSVARGVVTLITKNSSYSANPYESSGPNADGIFYSLAEYLDAKEELAIEDTSLDIYVKAFFANKGKALKIIGGYQSGSVVEFIIAVMNQLDYRNIIIVSDANEQDLRAAASQTEQTQIIPDPITAENTVPTFSGLNEKYFIASTSDLSGKLYDSITGDSAPTFAPNKYYNYNNTTGQYDLLQSAPSDWSSNYINYFEEAEEVKLNNYLIKVGEKGIEMLAAAYLSQVRINDASTINDYAFTIENLGKYDESSDLSKSLVTENNVGVKLVKSHFNFDTILVNAIRNYPGDTITGADMMNYYLRILVVQDLSEAILNLLASKIRFNQAGVNRLNNVISQVMNTYISNGYLNTEEIYTEEDLYYNFNGQEYLICSRNTPLVKGYKCVILPLDSLTQEQKQSHVLPPVYILLADQTGIRAVVIDGNVL